MKIIKILITGVIAVALVALIVVGIFIATFDANQYKQELSGLVFKQTGRELTFQGDIGLTLYPSLGMNLGSMTFANRTQFGGEPMVAVSHVSVSVDVLSLLTFEPQVERLMLEGLTVNLQKNTQGETNWDDLVAGDDKETVNTSADKGTAANEDSGFGFQGSFGGLNITNASLNWSDATTGAHYQLQNLSLMTGRIAAGESFALQLAVALQSLNEFNANVQLTANVLLQKHKLAITSLKLESQLAGELVPVNELNLMISGDVDYSLQTKLLGVRGFNAKINTTGGVLEHADVSLAGKIGFDLNRQQLTVAVLDIQADLQGESVPDGKMKAALSATKLDLQLDRRSLELDDLMLALNENQFSGFLRVLDYAQPAVSFELAAKSFDVDKLMGVSDQPAQPVEPVDVATEAPAEDIEIKLPMELLRSLKLDGKLTIASLKAQRLSFNNVLLKLDAANGVVNLNPLKMDLYDGQLDGSVQINVKAEKPVYIIKKNLSSFQVGLFMQDFMGDDKVSGDANVQADLMTQGEWLSKLKANLNGKLAVHIKDGALKGFNIRHNINSARARLKGQQAPELVERKTDFSALSLSGVIKDGVFSSQDLDMQAPLIRVGGKGSVDLANETVNYLVNAKLVTTSKGQDGGAADELSGLLIPLAITGPWDSPKIDVQLDEMLKAKLNAEKARARELLASQKEELKQKLAAEKEKLKLSTQKDVDAKKRQLEIKKELAEAELKDKLAAEKAKAKKKLADKLKKLF